MSHFDIHTMHEVSIPSTDKRDDSLLFADRPRADDNDSESSSEEEDDLLKMHYANLPEDLGFTMVGLDFDENDLKIIRRLKLNFDVFMTLSEEELLELGVKDPYRIKRFVTSKLQKNWQLHNIFAKEKKSVSTMHEDIDQMYCNCTSVIDLIEKDLNATRFALYSNPPVNYKLHTDFSSLDIFKKTLAILMKKTVKGYYIARRQSQQLDKMAPNAEDKTLVKTNTGGKRKWKQVWIKRTLVVSTFTIIVFVALKKLVPSTK